MSIALITGGLWVLAAAFVAFLPMRWQYAPGFVLLFLAPILLIWITVEHGWLWLAFALFAFGSMFRNPLIYLTRRILGRQVEVPK